MNGNEMDTNIPFSNRLTMDQLSKLSVNDVLDLPIEQVKMLQDDIEATAETVKNAKAWLQNYLDVRFSNAANAKRSKAGKDTGIQRLDVDNYVVIADLKKGRTQWDQSLLKQAMDTVASWGSDVSEYVKTEYSVSETKYNAWEKNIKAVFDPARTVVISKQSYEIVPKK